MSIIGEHIPTDNQYPASVLWGIEAAYDELFSEEENPSSFEALGYLCTTMEEIKYRTAFYSLFRKGFQREDGLFYRTGVWKVIDDVLISLPGTGHCKNAEERAVWFQEIIHLTKKQIEVRELIAKFKAGLHGLQLELSIGDPSEAVNLILNQELTGQAAYRTAQTVVARLREAVKEYIELGQSEQKVLEGV